MLDADGFKAPGNRLQIYDFVDNGATPHINDQIGPDVTGSPLAQATAGVWPFVNGPHQWTPGMHRFFGWLALDANGTKDDTSDDLTPEAFFGTGFSFNETTKILTIPQKTMSADTPQFDFMYSNIYATEPINTPVELQFSHLFSAISIGAVNSTKKPITIHDFEVVDIYNSAKAEIVFSDKSATPSVNVKYSNYTQVYDTDELSHDNLKLFKKAEQSYTMAVNEEVANIFTGNKTNREHKLIWPQIDRTNYPHGSMWVKYSYEGSETELTSRIQFPNIDLEPGKRYHFVVTFDKDPGSVWVNYIVAEWDDVTWDLEFEAPLHTFLLTAPDTNNAPDPETDPVIYYDNSTETGENGAFVGYFKMDSPAGITWKPTLIRGSAADYEVRVYTNKDENNQVRDNYDILVTKANIEAEKDRFYKVVVVAKNPDNIGKVVKLGMTYAPLWNQDANPLLIINKGDNSTWNTYYPWTGDGDTNNNPDECWISIEQISKPNNY